MKRPWPPAGLTSNFAIADSDGPSCLGAVKPLGKQDHEETRDVRVHRRRAALASSALAEEHHSGVKVGTLSCNESGGWGFIFGASHAVRCTFAGQGRVERYDGNIAKYGVDIGYQQSGVLIWTVFAPTRCQPGRAGG